LETMVVAAAEHAHDDLPATAEWRSRDHGLAVHRDYQRNSGYHDCRDQEAYHRTCIRTSTLLNSTAIVASIPPGDKYKFSGTQAAARALLSLAASARVGRREATLSTVTTE
jgi:hypothetical protein